MTFQTPINYLRLASPALLRWLLATSLIACGFSAQAAESPSEPSRARESSHDVYFGTDVVPILTKLGCNSGGCHGKATGENGFKLSFFGFEPTVKEDRIVQMYAEQMGGE